MKGEILKLETAEKLQRIEKAIKYIKETTYSDITGLEKHNITEFWFVKEILDILEGTND